MVDSPGTSAGAVIAESQGQFDTGTPSVPGSAGSIIGDLPGSTTRGDSPAAQLQDFYTARGSSGSLSYNQSAAVASKFSAYLGFNNQGQYDFNYRVFPDDLGSDASSHYMIININVQVNSDGQVRTNQLIPNQFGPANFTVTGEYSKVDQLKFGSNVPGVDGILGQSITDFSQVNLPRGTRRIKESIALYMPLPTVYTHTNVYEEISLTAFGAQALKLGVSAVGKLIGAGITGALTNAIGRGASSIFDAAGNLIRKGAAVAGYPINPKIEVLFSHTTQRSFRMEILMAPKNENESLTIKNIIDTMRYHAAPEISGYNLTGNLGIGSITFPTFIAPAEFDITFYHKGKENTTIPRINTCALEQIEVDYAPTGVYSTFSNGHAVAIRLSLAFRELEILHKQRVAQGF